MSRPGYEHASSSVLSRPEFRRGDVLTWSHKPELNPLRKSSHSIPPAMMGALATRLSGLADLTPEEVRLLHLCSTKRRYVAPGASIFESGEGANEFAFVMSGWACHQRLLLDGRRQILGFLLPGDIVGPYQGVSPLALANTVAVTPLVISDGSDLLEALTEEARYHGLATAIWRAAQEHEGLLIDHVVRLGQLKALERMVDFMIELWRRMGAAGLVNKTSFHMPLTQEVLGDALGLSSVHINRILQQLRAAGLIALSAGELTLLDVGTLEAVASGNVQVLKKLHSS